MLLLAQVVVLVLVGRALGEVMQRIGQPSIIGQIIAGLILGPSVIGGLWPAGEAMLFPSSAEQSAMINGISQLGILFLLLLAGMEADLGLAYRLRNKAFSVSLAGIAVPFVCGFALGMLMPKTLLPDPDKRLAAALFLGTALSISSLKIVATVVREMNFMRRDVGQLIVASAVIDDTVGWVVIAVTLGVATTGSVNIGSLAVVVGGTLVFLALTLTVGRRVVPEIIRWTNDSLQSDASVITAIIGIMGILALATASIGVQTVLGAFVAGLLIGQSPILTRRIDEQLRGLTSALFMPVFFGLTGLHADLRVLADPATLMLTLGLILIASIGKFGGAFVGAVFNGLSRREALALGFGMNARGSTEVIVATIGLSLGILDQRLFSVIVTMAIVTTLIMPPTLRWALKRLPLTDEERQRLDREQFEANSAVSTLERILLVADGSANGQLAAAIAGPFGGLQNMPITAIGIELEVRDAATAQDVDERVEGTAKEAEPATVEQVKDSSAQGTAKARETDDTRVDIHVGTRAEHSGLAERLSQEAKKGHDLLFVGVEPLRSDGGGYDGRIETMLTAFGQSTVIVSARGGLRRKPQAPLRLLVPVSADVRSIRAAEFAVLLAKATSGKIAALHVAPAANGRKRGSSEVEMSAEAIFEHVRQIGKHYEVEVKTIIEIGRSPGLAIAAQARHGRYNLVVMGVGRRAGDGLTFGPVPDTLLDTLDRSLMFFVSD